MGSSIFVRPNGEVDIAAVSPDGSLMYYWSAPGSSTWIPNQVAGPGSTVLDPSIVVRPDGEVDIVAKGSDNSLMYYWANKGIPWTPNQVAGPGTTFSPPSIIVRPDGEVDIVAQGPGSSLMYYWANQGIPPWTPNQVAGPGTTFSSPSIFVRPDGEVDIVAQGPARSLMYYRANKGIPWAGSRVVVPEQTINDPSIFVRPDGEVDIVALTYESPTEISLFYYYRANQGTQWNSIEIAAPGTSTLTSNPSIFVRPDGEADVVARGVPDSQVMYYSLAPGGSTWTSEKVNTLPPLPRPPLEAHIDFGAYSANGTPGVVYGSGFTSPQCHVSTPMYGELGPYSNDGNIVTGVPLMTAAVNNDQIISITVTSTTDPNQSVTFNAQYKMP
jgi:acylphosphatase